MTDSAEKGSVVKGIFPVGELRKLNALVALSEGDRTSFLAEMRARYANNPQALKRIDAYDPDSDFSIRMHEIVDVANTGDFEKVRALRAKLQADFPGYPNT